MCKMGLNMIRDVYPMVIRFRKDKFATGSAYVIINKIVSNVHRFEVHETGSSYE